MMYDFCGEWNNKIKTKILKVILTRGKKRSIHSTALNNKASVEGSAMYREAHYCVVVSLTSS